MCKKMELCLKEVKSSVLNLSEASDCIKLTEDRLKGLIFDNDSMDCQE